MTSANKLVEPVTDGNSPDTQSRVSQPNSAVNTDYRDYFRQTYVPRDAGLRFLKMTNGRHYLWVVLATLTSVPLLLASAIDFTATMLLLCVPYFLICNLGEYVLHRYPMHKRTNSLEFLYEHVTVHHRFYRSASTVEDDRDLFAVFLPIAYMGSITLAFSMISAVVYLISGSLNHALFFALFAFCYYLLYELMHYAYHCAPESPIRLIPGIARLSQLHLSHHNPKLMNRYNFNITFPVFDLICGTYLEEPPSATAGASTSD